MVVRWVSSWSPGEPLVGLRIESFTYSRRLNFFKSGITTAPQRQVMGGGHPFQGLGDPHPQADWHAGGLAGPGGRSSHHLNITMALMTPTNPTNGAPIDSSAPVDVLQSPSTESTVGNRVAASRRNAWGF
ncbi:hypothetical protein THAOC_02182 [Thalassiosira oceanica]|uniref:Uncharacterized protein n=1 Tax=Thalassiosira oceanica TaxID=159749 RepID=K0TF79_THAOC|nr:hypothetical protein THAOC_02182 [Thalassiosira oceanica]|eukprot:EJK76075.1 hypothetical protein THAOC_02182 [Thalassiosira oceanica]